MLGKLRFYVTALLSLVVIFALCSSAFAGTVGQQLSIPEDGWQRIDDTDPGITYTGVWNGYTDSTHGAGQWNTSYHGTAVYGSNNSTQAGGSLKFSFVGTKLRWIAYSNVSCSKENTIKVDGQVVATNVNSGIINNMVGQTMLLIYEKTDLPFGMHTVEITANSVAQLIVDAFDIDSTGYVIGNISAPSITAASNENSRVSLNWISVSNATGYNIKRSLTSGGPYTTIASNVTGATFTDPNVVNGTTYYYVVTAVNAAGESANSNEASAIPQFPAPSAPINLTAAASNSQVFLLWNPVPEATSYTVSRSTYSGGPYTTVTSVTYNTYMNIGLTNGMTYYYVVQAVNAGGTSGYSNEAVAALPMPRSVLDIDIVENRVRVGQEFTSNIILKDVAGIYAEDFTIQYNDNLFEFRGFEEIPGYKVYHAINHSNGTLRFIVASQGAEFGINSDTIFLKLKFKAKAVGIGKVDATQARIADTTAEYDLDAANCLEDTVVVESQDVNMSGEYTLLDLAIDAAHFGELGSTVDPTKYAANQVGDDTIRDEDLVFIVAKMLANTHYAPNNKK